MIRHTLTRHSADVLPLDNDQAEGRQCQEVWPELRSNCGLLSEIRGEGGDILCVMSVSRVLSDAQAWAMGHLCSADTQQLIVANLILYLL